MEVFFMSLYKYNTVLPNNYYYCRIERLNESVLQKVVPMSWYLFAEIYYPERAIRSYPLKKDGVLYSKYTPWEKILTPFKYNCTSFKILN